MTDNNYELPWRAEDNGLSEYMIVDSDNDVVAYVAAAGDEGSANLIAKSVNYHHRLRGALEKSLLAMESYEETVDFEWGECRDIDHIASDGDLPEEIVEARALLAELDNLENGA